MEQKYYHMTIAGCERDLPLCPLNEDMMIAAFVIFGDAELTVACVAELLKKAPEYDYILTAEAKGIPLAHEMARLAGNQKYFVARKYPKLYMTGVFEAELRSITTDKVQKLYLDTADAELIRGKTGRVYGDLMALLTTLKGLPLAYNKDMQEDKEPVFDAVDTAKICLELFADMLDTATFNVSTLRDAVSKGFINATDCADYMVKKGLPFRDAYRVSGKV